MEAIARGKPLISTKTGNDYLTEEVSHINLDTVNKDTISDAVVDMIANYDTYLGKATSQMARFQKLHSWEFKYDIVSSLIDNSY